MGSDIDGACGQLRRRYAEGSGADISARGTGFVSSGEAGAGQDSHNRQD